MGDKAKPLRAAYIIGKILGVYSMTKVKGAVIWSEVRVYKSHSGCWVENVLEELDGRREMGGTLLQCSGREDGGLAEVVVEEEVDGGGGRREPDRPQDHGRGVRRFTLGR